MLYAIAIVACTTAALPGQPQGEKCQNFKHTIELSDVYDKGITPFMCAKFQTEIVKWNEEHPSWVVKKWSCPQPNAGQGI